MHIYCDISRYGFLQFFLDSKCHVKAEWGASDEVFLRYFACRNKPKICDKIEGFSDMLMLTATLMARSLPWAKQSSVTCGIIREEFNDAFLRNPDRQFELYFDAKSPAMKSYPALRSEKPAEARPANDDAWARANDHGPRAGQTVKGANIYAIDVPQFASDTQSATVKVSYTCTGLCGGGWISRYVRTAGGWRRDGHVGTIYVS